MTKVLKITKKQTIKSIVKSGSNVVTLSPSSPKTAVVQISEVAPASVNTYTHIQSTPSTTWTVVHNLGYHPGGVSVIDSAGTKVYGDVTHINNNQLVINFSAGFSGKVYLS